MSFATGFSRCAIAAMLVVGSAAMAGRALAGDNCSSCWRSADDDWYLHHSTPEERAETQQLNRDYLSFATAPPVQPEDDGDYRQQRYQDQLDQYRAANRDYRREMEDFAHLSARYRAEREAYRRDAWPRRDWWLRDSGADIARWPVLTMRDGAPIGSVSGVARSEAGRLEALRVVLREGPVVWIDASDLRFDPRAPAIITDLDLQAIREMAAERP